VQGQDLTGIDDATQFLVGKTVSFGCRIADFARDFTGLIRVGKLRNARLQDFALLRHKLSHRPVLHLAVCCRRLLDLLLLVLVFGSILAVSCLRLHVANRILVHHGDVRRLRWCLKPMLLDRLHDLHEFRLLGLKGLKEFRRLFPGFGCFLHTLLDISLTGE